MKKKKEKKKSLVGGLVKSLTSKGKIKKIIKKQQATVKIPEYQPAEYNSYYFKKEWEDAKGEPHLFFK